jgi:hypothetical protein
MESPTESRTASSKSSVGFEGIKDESELMLGATNCSFSDGCAFKYCRMSTENITYLHATLGYLELVHRLKTQGVPHEVLLLKSSLDECIKKILLTWTPNIAIHRPALRTQWNSQSAGFFPFQSVQCRGKGILRVKV